ncbi:helix-turn-helix transcriptional regulator [Azospirillum endophyticum]
MRQDATPRETIGLVQAVPPTFPQVAYGWRASDGQAAELASLPAALGWTEVVQHSSRAGLRLSEVRTHPHAEVVFTTRQVVPQASLMFAVQWAGGNRMRYPGIAETWSRLDRWRFLRLAATDDRAEYENLTGATSDVMTLVLSLGRLEEMLDGWEAPALVEEMRKGAFTPGVGDVAMTPALHSVLQQIRSNPYRGTMAGLYVEAKVCEWLAEAFAGMAEHPPSAERALGRSRRAALAARDRLMADLGNPPSMEVLARDSGLSQHRLNELFRELFGATPFQCLNRWRLDQAKLLLAAGELSVKQVAHLMGYAHVSSFSHAYKRRFGVSPSGGAFS